MKRTITLTLSIIISCFSFKTPAQQTGRITPNGIGYYEYLPDGYRSNSDKYPVVIFLHGYKEKGTSSTDPDLVMRELPRAAYVGLPRYVKEGKKYPFILISPQLKSQYSSWPPSYIMQVLNHVKKTLRIDDRRIYLTGLSLGGFGVWKTAGEYPQVFAAIGPLCSGANALDKAHAIAREDVAVWAFHGGSDHVVSHTVTTRMVDAINTAPHKPNPLAKVTIFPGMAHNIWDKAYLQSDLLKWMLTIRNGSGGSSGGSEEPPSNRAPVANAGQSKSITLPANSAQIKGSASDEDGEIVSFRWTKVSGGEATLEYAEKPELHVSDLKEGTYVFRLTAKDNDGASDSDDMTLTVKPAANKPPVVDAGSNRSVTLPDNTIDLAGTASDPDGEIESYEWRKVSGGTANMSGASSKTLHISGLEAGNYVFRLTATDNDGKAESDDVAITVKEEPKENKSPIVKAGGDRSVTLPNDRLEISATADDEDGSIQSYEWTQLSGPSVSISGERSATLVLSGLRQGSYAFRLTVTDDKGAKGLDEVGLTVHAQKTVEPQESAEPDENIAVDESAPPVAGESNQGKRSPSARDVSPVLESTPERTTGNQNKRVPVAGQDWLNW